MSTQTIEQTNSLRYSVNKIVGKEHIYVKIHLDDECHNGHQDFSITGDIYEAGKPKIDRYFISGGCIHEEILKHFPQFKPFIDLHLCDYKGIPMHPSANMRYFLREGFNKTKPNNPNFKKEYCDYYRITPEQFTELNEVTENEIQFALKLEKSGILNQWEQEANKAIEMLEGLTGKKFFVDSERTQFVEITAEQRAEEAKRQAEGYYLPEAKEAREQTKRQKEFDKLKAEFDKEVEKAQIEYDVKKEVLTIGGSKALGNIIFYNHTKTLAFNWRSYDKMDEAEVAAIIEKLNLPEGVKAIDAKGK